VHDLSVNIQIKIIGFDTLDKIICNPQSVRWN